MATWWVTEAIPLAATSLLPLALFPFLGLGTASESAAPYANHLVYLFLGGFMLAQAMQRWNLHRRMALTIVHRIGTSPSRIVLGFMCASGFVSMWVSNTATTAMMMPIGLAVIQQAVEAFEKEGAAIDTPAGPFPLWREPHARHRLWRFHRGRRDDYRYATERLPRGNHGGDLWDRDFVSQMARLRNPVRALVSTVDVVVAHTGGAPDPHPVASRRRGPHRGGARQARAHDDSRKTAGDRLRTHRRRRGRFAHTGRPQSQREISSRTRRSRWPRPSCSSSLRPETARSS